MSGPNTEDNTLSFIENILQDLGIQYERYKLFISNSKKWIVDLFFEVYGMNYFVEIKYGKYIHPNYVEELILLKELFGKEGDVFYLIMSGDSRFYRRGRNLFNKSGWELIKLDDRDDNTLTVTYDEITHNIINNIKLLSEPDFEPEIREPEYPEPEIREPEYEEPYVEMPHFEEQDIWMNIQDDIGIDNTLRIAGKFHYDPRISREILDLLPDLTNIDYANILKKFYKEHEKITNYDEENKLIIKYLIQLWSGKYGKEDSGKSFELYEKFETILKYIEGYRDHFVHQFQVFLIGAIIIDKNYSDFVDIYRNSFQNMKEDSLDFSWLLCSTFHDFCYPIQLYDQFNVKFFKEFLNITSNIIEINYEKILLEKNYLKYIDQLVSLYDSIIICESNWVYDQECRINNFMRSLFLNNVIKGNHAILSSITLIDKMLEEKGLQDYYDEYIKGRLSTDVMPASLAVSLHDEKIFSLLPEEIELKSNLLSFLLIFCDTAQECGRLDDKENVEIYKFEIYENIIDIGLIYYDKKYFDNKKIEIDTVFEHIISENYIFNLEIKFGKTTYSKKSSTT